MSKEGEGMMFEDSDKRCFLVAGGAGFLGSALCRELVKRGHSVWYISRSVDNGIVPGAVHIKQDIVEGVWLDYPLDYIIHLASYVSPRDFLKHPEETLLTNSEGTRNLLFLAKKKEAKFLYISSARVYRGEDPTEERAVYEQAKRFGEALTATRGRLDKIDARIVRLWSTYGPGCRINDGHVIPEFIRQALTNKTIEILGGSQRAHFNYIDDVIDGLCRVIFQNSGSIKPIDLGTRESIAINDLAKLIIGLCGSLSPLIQRPFWINDEQSPDIFKMRELNWKPRVGYLTGLVKTIDYFKEIGNVQASLNFNVGVDVGVESTAKCISS